MDDKTEQRDREVAEFAADPTRWTDPRGVLTGDAAAMFGRDLLAGAGVDVEQVERAVGRPRVDGGTGAPGERSPRVGASVATDMADWIDQQVSEGRARSTADVVRAALAYYRDHVPTGRRAS